MNRAVLMGDPTYFSIKAGANPHTRTRWGRRKKVDRRRAIDQWHGLARLLGQAGVTVFVVPPDPRLPGLVYPANAGFLFPSDEPLPAAQKRFYLANLLAARAGEQPVYRRFVEALGFRTAAVRARFEGEADFFPAGARYLFTFGRIERQRFRLRWGFPPYARVYGFRSEWGAVEQLVHVAGGREVLELELCDEAYYHGDTALCSFGEGRRHLLAYLAALTPASAARLREAVTDHLIPLTREDAALYAANSFPLERDGRHYLFVPAGVSADLLAQIRRRGVEPIPVDVSEFLAKGGGSVKCMLCDLGPRVEESLTPAQKAFRAERSYGALFA